MSADHTSTAGWRSVLLGARGRLLSSYIVLLLVLLVGLAAAYSSAQTLRTRFTHTVNVVDALNTDVSQTARLLDDQETGLRGYLLTGDRVFLQPYTAATKRLPALQEQLYVLTATDSRSRRLLETMLRDARAWQAWAAPYLQQTTFPARTSPAFTAAMIQGKDLFDRFRQSADRVTTYLAAERAQNLQQSLKSMDQSGGVFFLVLIVMVCVVTLVGWLATRDITRSLDQLAQAATVVGRGDFSQPITVSGATEFVQLGVHMDWMRRQLHSQHALAEVLGSSLRLEAVWAGFAAALRDLVSFDHLSLNGIDSSSDGTMLTTLYAEGAASDQFISGSRTVASASFGGLLSTQKFLLLPDLAAISQEVGFLDVQAGLRAGLRSTAIVPLRANGQYVGSLSLGSKHIGAYSEELLGPVLTLAPLVGAAIENAHLYTSLDQVNGALSSANQELEAFAFSVSHDLRAPLRSIAGFSQALVEDYADVLDAEGQQHLHLVLDASRTMGQIIDALLTLSRITRGGLDRQTTDLGALARTIFAELAASEPARMVDVVVADGLEVSADGRLMRVALTNLLGNAWKFTRDTPAARIEVGVAASEGTRSFFVRDNGAGFDMAYVGKLFGAFQRLHSISEFEGTGIGLATVQRIIRRHGGRIWAEGAVGEGAVISFTLGAEEAMISGLN